MRWFERLIHEVVRRRRRQRQTAGDLRRMQRWTVKDKQALRKKLAALCCNFEQACEELRIFSPKHAYIGQAS